MPHRSEDRELVEPYKSAIENPTPDNLLAGEVYRAVGVLNRALRKAGEADLHIELRYAMMPGDPPARGFSYGHVSIDAWKRHRVIGVWNTEHPATEADDVKS